MKGISDSSHPEDIERFNNLRDKLSDLSNVYKKKYPNCLPIPTFLIHNELQED